MISVQKQDFCLNTEYQRLKQSTITGAVVTFTGIVREFSHRREDFYLQHYPGMTESVLEQIEQKARSRWPLIETTIIHRVGTLNMDDQIVFVGASSAHREHAFAAAQFMIDILKNEAPFWKKEGHEWVKAKASDTEKADRWLQGKS